MIWKIKPDVNVINKLSQNTLASHLGIEVMEVGPDYVKGRMPVDERTRQPAGLLHGGASVVLSESMGSVASYCLIEDITRQSVVGVEINANHLRSVKSGFVYSITRPIKIGRTLHIWNTEIFDESENLICVSRLTVLVTEKG
jgi:1,4-dihydroxy-2-naphthoyl-CoA hydrolase